MYLENFIKNFRLWQGGESIFIEAPTGMGKTTFVLNQLVEDAMKDQQEVLFLSNRYLLKEQIKHSVAKKQGIPVEDNNWLEEVEEFEGITVISYQKVQVLMEMDNAERYLNRERYKFTVFDEIHYILEDSLFNPHIYYLLQFIRKAHSIKVFMSATLEETQDYLINTEILGKVIPYSNVRLNEFAEREQLDGYIYRCTGRKKYIWKYSIPKQRRKLIVKYFEDFSQIVELINRSEEKWLIFVSNKASVGSWKCAIRKSVDVIYADDKDEEIVDQIVKYEKFNKQVLITTKLLDNGVNFKDRQLCNIVIDTISRVEFLQMLGRKRILGDEAVKLFIPKKSRKYFTGYYNLSILKSWELVNKGKTSEDLMKECFADPTVYEIVRRFYIVQNGTLTLNPAGAHKLGLLEKFLRDMQKAIQADEWAFVKEQLKWLDMKEDFSEKNLLPDVRKEKVYAEVNEYLKKSAAVWMDKERQNEFRQELGKLLCQAGLYEKRGNRAPGKQVIEKIIKAEFPRYDLEVKKASRKGEISLWRIVVKKDVLGDQNSF